MLVARLGSLAALALALALMLPALAGAQSTRVKNGFDAADGEYPWTVALVTAGQDPFDGQFCGGTLIRDDTVVTAAHCVYDRAANELDVVAGVTRLSDLSTSSTHGVASIALHPQEDVEESETRYDAAILKLATPVDPSVAPPIALAPADAAPPVEYTVSGWGMWDDPFATGSDFPDRLQAGEIDPVSDATCEAAWEDVFDAADMVCALRVNGPTVTDACGGDSGGPLVNTPADPLLPAGVLLYGAVSFGSADCEDETLPGVYTRLTAPVVHAWVTSAIDGDTTNDPVVKPRYVGGAPSVVDNTKVDQTVSCTTGNFEFASDDPRQPPTTTELLVRRVDGPDLVTVDIGAHRLTAADHGHQFLCEARGRVTGGGGYAMARSSRTAVVAYVPPGQPPVQQPPVTQVPVPVPVPVPTPVPRDTSRPTVTKVSRKCTRKRSCTFTISAKDGTGPVVAGVTAVQATLTSITTRTCKRKGKRVRCARTTTRTVHPRKRSDGRFSLALSKLPKGRHTITLQAIDGAGNLQRTAYRVRFTLK